MVRTRRPTFVSSGTLTHSTVWPQYINVTDRQTGQRGQTTVRWHRANRFTNGRSIKFCMKPSECTNALWYLTSLASYYSTARKNYRRMLRYIRTALSSQRTGRGYSPPYCIIAGVKGISQWRLAWFDVSRA